MRTGEVMRAWLVAVAVAGMCAGAAAQSVSGPEKPPPAAPAPGNAAPIVSDPSAKEPPVVVEPVGPPAYTPLTSHQKFHIFVQQTYSVYTVANTAFDAGWAQMTDDWPAYGQGMEGYGKRYGALLANHEAGTFFENFLFPTLLRQDPRYFRKGEGHSLFARVPYAASRVLITQSDSGHSTFNSSLLLGLLFVDGITNAYYPRPERGLGNTMTRFGGSVLSSAETNLLREFMPDMMRVFHRHEPEKLKKLEELEKKVPLADKLTRPNDGTVQPASAASAPSAGAAGSQRSPEASSQVNSSSRSQH
ncbi:MAG TPA: hypothetical protein VKB60_06630 [Terriglobales bacterium]|nr:hypothetical protein [Terriglobales bacterium]